MDTLTEICLRLESMERTIRNQVEQAQESVQSLAEQRAKCCGKIELLVYLKDSGYQLTAPPEAPAEGDHSSLLFMRGAEPKDA